MIADQIRYHKDQASLAIEQANATADDGAAYALLLRAKDHLESIERLRQEESQFARLSLVVRARACGAC